ncbi:MAG: hypothetical protein ABI661_03735 [Gammaproteobacteria bacterium]
MSRIAAVAAGLVFALALQGCGGGSGSQPGDGGVPLPTVTLSATPAAVLTNGAAALSWSTTNADSCTASGGWVGVQPFSGTAVSTGSLATTTTFTLTCVNANGSQSATASAMVTVTNVPPPPTMTLSAIPGTVISGNSSTLAWTSFNSTGCTATGNWSGAKGTSGSVSTGALTAAKTYTLTCVGAGGSVNQTVTVSVTTANTSYSTTFNLTENPISESGTWHRANNGFTNVRTSGGHAYGTNGPSNTYDDSYALLSGFGNDYSVEATIYRDPNLNQGATHEVELLVRFHDDSSGAYGYECLFGFSGNLSLTTWNGDISNFHPTDALDNYSVGRQLQTGDVIKVTVSGNLFIFYLNGVEVARGNDSTYPTGQPGIGFFTRPGGNSANFAMDSYTVTSN